MLVTIRRCRQNLSFVIMVSPAFLQTNGGCEMIIKAVKFRKDGFYTQPFAFGGEEGP